jgi:hypothetical protein
VEPRFAPRGQAILHSFVCTALFLAGAIVGVRSSNRAAFRHEAHTYSLAVAGQASGYEAMLLNAPAPLAEGEGRGAGAGQAVGTGRIPGSAYPTDTHAVFWPKPGGAGVDLHPPDFRHSAALGTDGLQQVGHGNGPPTRFARHALLWRGSANVYIDLHPAGTWNDSVAVAVAGGQQAGNINNYFYTTYERDIIEHAALWHGTAASVIDLHPRGIGCERSYANDTDGRRQVGYGYFPAQANNAPYRALLWSGAATSAVVLHPPGYTHSFAEGVEGDEQVGYAFDARSGGHARALLWRGTASSVVSLHPAGYVETTALSTNGTLQVGFGSTPATGTRSHALLWSGTAGSVEDLHSMLPAEFAQGGSIAQDVDDEGNIVGLAQRPDGSTVAVLWRRVNGSQPPRP